MSAFDMGSAMGGFVNAAVSAINAAEERDEARRARQARARAVEQGRQMAMHDYDTLGHKLNEYNDSRIRLADDDMVNDLRTMMSGYDPEVYDFGMAKVFNIELSSTDNWPFALYGLKLQADVCQF